jgi:hypothetical protein
MRLYMRKEALKWSLERWGGLEGLAEEQRKREVKKWEASVERTQGMFDSNKASSSKASSSSSSSSKTSTPRKGKKDKGER